MIPIINRITLRSPNPGGLRRFYEELGMSFEMKNRHYIIKLANGLELSISMEPDLSPISDHFRLGLVVDNVTKRIMNLRMADLGEIIKAAYQGPIGAYAKLKDPDGHVIILTEGR